MNKRHRYLINQVLGCGDALNNTLKWVEGGELWFKPAPTEWNIHQIVTHLRDVQRDIFLPRVSLALRRSGYPIAPFDANAYMQAHYSPDVPLRKVYSDFRTACRRLAERLEGLPDEQWTLYVAHPKITKMSIEWLAWHTIGHTHEHLSQIIGNRDQFLLKNS